MKTGLKGALAAFVMVMGLGLAACESRKENAPEDQTQAVGESSDATGDALEHVGERMGGATGEAKGDEMEDQADKVDKSPG